MLLNITPFEGVFLAVGMCVTFNVVPPGVTFLVALSVEKGFGEKPLPFFDTFEGCLGVDILVYTFDGTMAGVLGIDILLSLVDGTLLGRLGLNVILFTFGKSLRKLSLNVDDNMMQSINIHSNNPFVNLRYIVSFFGENDSNS